MKKLGLVGGISWVSTIDYYRYINEGVNAALGGLQFPECLLYSLNFGALQEAGWDHALPLLLNATRRLQSSGADAIVLCANTAHMYAEQIQVQLDVPIIHIVDATLGAVEQQNLRSVGLLGTKWTMESDLYVTRFRHAGIEIVTPEAQDTRDYIQSTLREELGRGILRSDTKAAYLRIMADLRDRGAEGIILGCTEIPLLIAPADFEMPLFDTTKIHAQAAIQFVLTSGMS